MLISLILHATPWLDSQNQKLSHSLYKERPINDDILIIGIDDKTLQEPSEGGLGSMSEWPRDFWADVIETARDGGAKAIFVDVLFGNASQSVSYFEIATLYQDIQNAEEVGEELIRRLADDFAPQDYRLANAIQEDTFLLKLPVGAPRFEDGVLHVDGERTSIKVVSEKGPNVFARSSGQRNQDFFYAMPVGYVNGGEFEELAGVALAGAYLNSGQGILSPDHKDYILGNTPIPLDKGEMFINYAAPSYSFPMISFTDVYRGGAPQGTFDGKIVMIGATAPILQDRHFTPIDTVIPMPGVEIQANLIQTILDGEFLSPQRGGQFFVMTGILVAIGLVIFLFTPVWAGLVMLALEVIAFPFIAQALFNRGSIPDLIWPMVALIATYLLALAYRYVTEFWEKRQLREAFSHYVAPEVVDEISEDPEELKLGGDRRNITVLFLDIANFTQLSESMSAEEVVDLINTYFGAFTDVIMDLGGAVDKFEGDAIMALFGAPVDLEAHAQKALQAAIGIQKACAEMNVKQGRSIRVRIGLSTGEAIVGNMGSEDRFDYTAMGDTVNIASRLQEANKQLGTSILMNATLAASLPEGAFPIKKHDPIKLKGIEKPVEIFSIDVV